LVDLLTHPVPDPEPSTSQVHLAQASISKCYVTVPQAQASTSKCDKELMRKNFWDMEKTLILLDKVSQRKEQLQDSKYKKTEVYKVIAKEMNEQTSYTVTPEQIQNRTKTLHAKFKEVKDHNNRTGNAPKSWEYYDVMENFIGQDRPNVNPVAVCSSLAASMKQNITEASASPERMKNKMKRQRNSPRTEMSKFLKDYKAEVEERENRRIALAEKHHNETKEMFASLMKILEDKNKK
jgi:hypothetical protein